MQNRLDAVAVTLLALLSLLTVALGVVPSASAGTADAPELADPADDVAVDAGPLVVPGQEPAFAGLDILAVYIAQEGSEATPATFTLNVVLADAFPSGSSLQVGFAVDGTSTSLPGGVTGTQTAVLNYDGTTVTGLDGVTASGTTTVAFEIPLVAIGAAGGDRISNLTAATSGSDGGDLPDPITQDDSSAADQAPDEGGDRSAEYVLQRPPVAGDLEISVTPSSATVRGADGTAEFNVTVRNAGLDADTVTLLAGSSRPTARASFAPQTLNLEAGATGTSTMTVALTDATSGSITITVTLSSSLGGTATDSATLAVDVPSAPAPEERKATPSGLSFLTPAAEALGFDGPFGDYAELVLLALIVLAFILLVFLLLTLARRPWVRVRVASKTITAPPGGTAQVRFAITNAKRGARDAMASFRTLGDAWKAGLMLRQRQGPPRPAVTQPGEEVEIELTGRLAEGDTYDGQLRVKVPEDAVPGSKSTVELDVVPLSGGGERRPAHAASAKVTVVASDGPAVPQVKLDGVRHEPSDPEAGTPMRSTVTIRNEGDHGARLRVALQVDGKPAAEELVDVPPRMSRAVVLPWVAGEGRNQVKVQLFRA